VNIEICHGVLLSHKGLGFGFAAGHAGNLDQSLQRLDDVVLHGVHSVFDGLLYFRRHGALPF